jgi:hypothetical protein
LLPSPLPFLGCFASQTSCPTTTFGQAPKLGHQLASDSLRRPLTRVRHFGSLRRADIPKRPFFFFFFLHLLFRFGGGPLVQIFLRCFFGCVLSFAHRDLLKSSDVGLTTAVFFSFATSNWIFVLFLFFFLFFLGRFFAKLLMIDLRGYNSCCYYCE